MSNPGQPVPLEGSLDGPTPHDPGAGHRLLPGQMCWTCRIQRCDYYVALIVPVSSNAAITRPSRTR